MADQRRSSARGPRGRTGPGRTPAARRAAEARAAAAAAADRLTKIDPRANPRLTGRAAVLVLVVAVLVVSFASSLKAYLQQRDHIDTMRAQIAQRTQAIDELQSEKERWKDPAYVEQQARERFGYVMPGETAYVALDANGKRIEPESTLTAPDAVGSHQPKAWWEDAWASVALAGDPPALDERGPARKINGAKEEKESQ
ncbi:septum formation initiator family protein [Nocardioides sp. CER19]|uniref:FtsB family cell division protein n=1 Tax=Nocardioides sp. CER19 TaxID=3038538 RepID=UPI002448CDD2|nr:septum formation initiator family protein [Nocardioides sp. CER19]MDH2414862.1 septum formation initiator family protein [Nocardioides sp. CER19]